VILLTIAIYSDHHGEWYADQATLQKRARLTRRRVKQVLDDLVAAGELAVVSRHGRGRLSNYRLLIGPKNVQQAAPIPEKKGEAESTFSAQKAEAESTFPTPKQEADSRFSHPPCPPFPPHPQSPLNPPEKLKQEEETFGLPPAPSQSARRDSRQTCRVKERRSRLSQPVRTPSSASTSSSKEPPSPYPALPRSACGPKPSAASSPSWSFCASSSRPASPTSAIPAPTSTASSWTAPPTPSPRRPRGHGGVRTTPCTPPAPTTGAANRPGSSWRQQSEVTVGDLLDVQEL